MTDSQEQDARKRQRQRPLTFEEYNQYWGNPRLSMPAAVRIPLAGTTSFGLGMIMGMSVGGKMAGLRFRAEHAHRLPTTTTGWYLYHKSKNYHAAFGGLREGFKMGSKLGVMTLGFFSIENIFDVYFGSQTMFSSLGASLTVAGVFSLVTRLSTAQAARTIWTGLRWGGVYGSVQDLISLSRGRPVAYVEFIRTQLSKSSNAEEKETV